MEEKREIVIRIGCLDRGHLLDELRETSQVGRSNENKKEISTLSTQLLGIILPKPYHSDSN